jgi:proteic killer suppression protein
MTIDTGEEFALDNDNGYRYYQTMITSFRCRETKRIFKGKFSATLPQAIQRAAARDLDDLRTPPGNRLEALSGDRRGQHSIRINEQWRVCFVWQDGNANDVEIVDYH